MVFFMKVTFRKKPYSVVKL